MTTRRDFLKTAALTGSAAALAAAPAVHASSADIIRVGLVGCGGRGKGAAVQCVHGGQNVKLWAVGDAFRDRVDGALNEFRNPNRSNIGSLMDVPPERQFVGLNAYQDVIANCDLVILATPPGFRPIHLQAAVSANKHIFTEKPVAVDAPGVRTVLALHEEATRRGLCVVTGLQRHY